MATDDKLKYPNYDAMRRAQPPLMQTVGQGVRSIADTAGAAARGAGNLVNQAPKVVGVPAAGIANTVAKGVANFQTGFTGDTYKPQQFEALTLGQMWDKTMKPGTPTAATAPISPTAVAPVVKPVAPVAKPESGYVPGAGLPSKEQIASESARGMIAQQASDRAMGIAAPAPTAQPANINVSRQANGNLSFSGTGGGTGVTYSGMPNWTSTKGGAGQGAMGGGFNLAEQNARMAATLQGIQEFDRQKKVDTLTDAIASGAGGAVGVAQNKIALAGFSDILKQQMAGKSNAETAKLTAETQRRGQDLGLQGEMARVGASVYGTDVGAKNAAASLSLEKQGLDLKAAIAEASKSGDPEKTARARLLGLDFMMRTGIDPNTGKRITPEQQQELLKNNALAGSNPYGAGAVTAGGMQ